MTPAERSLWADLKGPQSPPDGRERARQELLGQYLPLVRLVVGSLSLNFPSATVESSDLIQSGVLGLMEALERFDPALNVEFRTYAQARIRGSVLDELRSLDWAPRSVRDKSRQLSQATESLNRALNRPPTAEEVADALNLTPDAFRRLAEEARPRSMNSLEALIEREGESEAWPRHNADPDAAELAQGLKELLRDGVESLAERDRLLLKRYYEHERTLKEIAQELGVTESRVCQIHGALLAKLKALLAECLEHSPPAAVVYRRLARS